jgi:hypothetical protein
MVRLSPHHLPTPLELLGRMSAELKGRGLGSSGKIARALRRENKMPHLTISQACLAEPLLALVRRPVGEVDDTRVERPRIYEFQRLTVVPVLEEALPTPQNHGMDNETDLV